MGWTWFDSASWLPGNAKCNVNLPAPHVKSAMKWDQLKKITPPKLDGFRSRNIGSDLWVPSPIGHCNWAIPPLPQTGMGYAATACVGFQVEWQHYFGWFQIPKPQNPRKIIICMYCLRQNCHKLGYPRFHANLCGKFPEGLVIALNTRNTVNANTHENLKQCRPIASPVSQQPRANQRKTKAADFGCIHGSWTTIKFNEPMSNSNIVSIKHNPSTYHNDSQYGLFWKEHHAFQMPMFSKMARCTVYPMYSMYVICGCSLGWSQVDQWSNSMRS